MKCVLAIVLLGLFSTQVLGDLLQVYNPDPESSKLKRKPFATPEKSDLLQEYKRSKRQASLEAMQAFQETLVKAKKDCVTKMGLSNEALQKILLHEPNPTPQEKCLIECILKNTEIMDPKNRLSTLTISKIADMVSNNNPLVSSIAIAVADHCNRSLTTKLPCEAAHQINGCIAREITARKVNIFY